MFNLSQTCLRTNSTTAGLDGAPRTPRGVTQPPPAASPGPGEGREAGRVTQPRPTCRNVLRTHRQESRAAAACLSLEEAPRSAMMIITMAMILIITADDNVNNNDNDDNCINENYKNNDNINNTNTYNNDNNEH